MVVVAAEGVSLQGRLVVDLGHLDRCARVVFAHLVDWRVGAIELQTCWNEEVADGDDDVDGDDEMSVLQHCCPKDAQAQSHALNAPSSHD